MIKLKKSKALKLLTKHKLMLKLQAKLLLKIRLLISSYNKF